MTGYLDSIFALSFIVAGVVFMGIANDSLMTLFGFCISFCGVCLLIPFINGR